MADVLAAVAQDRPVAMLVGNVIPRHWVLIVEATGERCAATSRRPAGSGSRR